VSHERAAPLESPFHEIWFHEHRFSVTTTICPPFDSLWQTPLVHPYILCGNCHLFSVRFSLTTTVCSPFACVTTTVCVPFDSLQQLQSVLPSILCDKCRLFSFRFSDNYSLCSIRFSVTTTVPSVPPLIPSDNYRLFSLQFSLTTACYPFDPQWQLSFVLPSILFDRPFVLHSYLCDDYRNRLFSLQFSVTNATCSLFYFSDKKWQLLLLNFTVKPKPSNP